MKKKILLSLLFLLFSSICTYSKTLITREYIPCEEISFIEINLNNEELVIQKYTGEDLLIEIYSNNSNIIPDFSVKNRIFNVSSKNLEFIDPIYCKVEVYVPVNFNPESIDIKNLYGISIISSIKAKDDFYFYTQTGSVRLNSITCSNFRCFSITSDINYENLNCDSFYLSTFSGNINLSLKNNTYILSSILSQTGNIKISYNEKATFQFLIYSENPLIRNKKSYNTKLNYNPEPENTNQTLNTILIDAKKGTVEINAD